MSNVKKPNTVEIVTNLAKPVLDELGLQLWDIRFEKEGASWYLRIFIDKDGGVNIDDCEAVSRSLDKIIDEADPISQAYYFEVSSPGIGRNLSKPAHFEAYIGEEVELRLIRPIDNVRDFKGKLIAHDCDTITIDLDGNEKIFSKKDTSYVRLYEEIDWSKE